MVALFNPSPPPPLFAALALLFFWQSFLSENGLDGEGEGGDVGKPSPAAADDGAMAAIVERLREEVRRRLTGGALTR